jgi:hypothetical protein
MIKKSKLILIMCLSFSVLNLFSYKVKRFRNNGNGTITDRKTGLMWQQVAIDKRMNWYQAKKYCRNLRLGGYTDWRLPEYKELRNLIKGGIYPPNKWLNKMGFKNFHNTTYWSNLVRKKRSNYSWYVDMRVGIKCYANKNRSYYVIAVRSSNYTGKGTKIQYETISGKRFKNNGNGTITDTKMNLMWQRVPTGKYMSFKNAKRYCRNLKLAGYKDWRLPKLRELKGLITGTRLPCHKWLNKNGFSNIKGNFRYFFAIKNTKFSYGMRMRDGYNSQTNKAYVIAVRKVTPKKRFKNNGNGTITDIKTGLIWQRVPRSKAMNWQNAKTYCDNLKLAGFTDWRLPTRKEIRELIKTGVKPYNEWLIKKGFRNIKSKYYWTSDVYKRLKNNVWSMQIKYNSMSYINKKYLSYVIAVRPAH